jgi:hypothetical protein
MSSQTSTGLLATTSFFDKERGKTFIVQCPSFDIMMSDSFLSLRTDRDKLSQNAILRLKCLLILLSLPEVALEEAAENLEDIANFYTDRFPQASLPNTLASTIKGTLKSAQVRPPIVLEP